MAPNTNSFQSKTYPFNPEDLLARERIDLDQKEAARHICGSKILITGAAGSIGSELVRQICGFEPSGLTLIDQSETNLNELDTLVKAEYPHLSITPVVGDITDYRRMECIVAASRPDLIFHAAAYKHVPVMEDHPYEAIKTNFFGTKVLADLAVRYAARKFIYISTDKAVKPASIMGATKRLAELYIRHIHDRLPPKTHFIITRFGNVLGSNGSFASIFKKQIDAGGPVTITHPGVSRYLMTAREACQLVLHASAIADSGNVLFFDMGTPVVIANLAKKMIELHGLTPYADIQIIYTGLRRGEKLHEDLLNNDEIATPTAHPKVWIAESSSTDRPDFTEIICQLNLALESGDSTEMRAALARILPDADLDNEAECANESQLPKYISFG